MRRALLLTLVLAAACARSESEWIAGLTSHDPFERVMAVTALAQPSRPEVLSHVLDALDDPEAQVREAAGGALVRMGRAATPALLEALRPDASPRDRLRSDAALLLLGEAAAEPLAEALLDGGYEQEAVLSLLARMGPEAGRPALSVFVEALGGAGASDRRARAAEGLAAVDANDRDVLWALLRATRDEDADVRNAALDSVVYSLLARQRTGNGLLRHAAQVELETLGPAALPSLARALRSAPEGEENEALAALAAHGVAALAPAFGALNPRDARHIGRANRLAAAIGPEALPVLLAMLDGSEPNLRLLAFVGLGALGEAARPAVPRLIAELRSSESLVRWGAAYALGLIGPSDDAQLELLVAAAEDPEGMLRKHLVPGLVRALLDRLASRPEQAATWRAWLDRLGGVARQEVESIAAGTGPQAATAAAVLAAPR